MQVRTPARQPGPRVGLNDVPSRYEAKQAGLDRTLLAAYTGTRRRHTRDRPLGSHGHYIVSLPCQRVCGSRPRPRAYSGACADGPAGERTAGPSAGTVASDLMSMRQPVSLAASLAFWPSLPIASDNW
jgi:hypothetical protein